MLQNQHYIPKFLLKNFVDTDGRMFCFNTRTNSIKKLPPKNAGSHLNFYEFSIHGKIVSFEDKLQIIETKSAPAFHKIINSNSLSNMTNEDRMFIADFVTAQSFRTKAFRKGLLDVEDNKIGETFEQLWESAFIISSNIKNRKWLLMKIEHDDIFYLGDQPVVLQNTENPSKAQSLGLDIKGVEAFLPLTPKLALYMPCKSTSDGIISGIENGRNTLDFFKSAKANGAYPIDKHIYTLGKIKYLLEKNKGFYNAITTGIPLVCIQENIDNLNYLQCAFSHENIFSNRPDFSFAKHVLTKTPQYRETMKTNILHLGNILHPINS
ncbi:MAG: DUF4238 domain-containing protein [Rickettsiales bacterium]